MKVRSCMILFDAVSPDDIFEQVLDLFYHGTCCKKMLGTMERDVLGDARCLQPVLQCGASHLVLEVWEDFCIGFVFSVIEASEFKSLFADRVVHKLLSLLHPCRDIHASVTVWLNLLPCQCLDVTLSESRRRISSPILPRRRDDGIQSQGVGACLLNV